MYRYDIAFIKENIGDERQDKGIHGVQKFIGRRIS